MKKWEPLYVELNRQRQFGQAEVTFSFREIADLIGGLPPSATNYRQFWANEDHGTKYVGHTWAWIDAGWRTGPVGLVGGSVTFKWVGRSSV